MKKFTLFLYLLVVFSLIVVGGMETQAENTAGDLDNHSDVKSAVAISDGDTGVLANVNTDGDLMIGSQAKSTYMTYNIGTTSAVVSSSAGNLYSIMLTVSNNSAADPFCLEFYNTSSYWPTRPAHWTTNKADFLIGRVSVAETSDTVLIDLPYPLAFTNGLWITAPVAITNGQIRTDIMLQYD